jgi:predicted TIM-barrel fold metal-dependent hydrolase
MDELGIDTQILYPTIFIEQVTDKAEIEVALCKAYDAWLSDIWKSAGGRLRWMCVLPLLSMQDTLDLLPWCKENGAVGVFMRPIEGPRLLHDPYFFPLYEAASQANMCIGVHVGNANPENRALFRQRNGYGGGFWPFITPMVGACHSAITSGLLTQFPALRMGFIESSASWIPWVIRDLRRRPGSRDLGEHFFADLGIFVSAFTTDDLAYITQQVGEGTLMIGTDYGHSDTSAELDALRTLSSQGGLDARVTGKILYDNPRAMYAL